MSRDDAFNLLVEQLMATKSEQSDENKPTFWLGAGCSVFDGVPLNAELVRQLTSSRGQHWGSDQYRFDQMFDGQPPDYRKQKLLPLLDKKIKGDSPYHSLVRLLTEGYLDTVLTFNIDTLMEQALEQAGLSPNRDYQIVSAPEMSSEAVRSRLLRPNRRITLVKLHGDVESGISLMTSEEIVCYADGLLDVVKVLSERPAVVCGYSFVHLNVLTAFSHQRRPLFYVNRLFPDLPAILSLMAARNRNLPDHYIDAPLGLFEIFMTKLATLF